ncbi:MAG TPA: polysaccharide deacetylase family protein [Kofleriaceae bacterium]|nr:polysaccharide deacetylase family protein [Kofleriaceae bacterium]
MGVEWALRPVLCTALIVLSAGSAAADVNVAHPRARHYDPCHGVVAPDPPGFGGRVALTFDDGPSVALTPRVLEILRRHRIPATFFLVGSRVRGKAIDLVREMAADPLFTIGNHTWQHVNLAHARPERALHQVTLADAAITDAAGATPHWFRFPYGSSSCATARMVRDHGYRIAGWHVDSADWCYAAGGGRCYAGMWKEVPDRLRGDMIELVRRRVRASGGGIVLLHDIHWRTVARLEQLIEALEKDGYTFVRLDDADVFPRLNRPDPPSSDILAAGGHHASAQDRALDHPAGSGSAVPGRLRR